MLWTQRRSTKLTFYLYKYVKKCLFWLFYGQNKNCEKILKNIVPPMIVIFFKPSLSVSFWAREISPGHQNLSQLPLNYQKLWLKQVCNIILRTLYVLINDRNSSLPDAKSEMIFSEWYLVISGHIIILHHATHVRHAATMTADKGGSSFVNQCLGKKTDREDNNFSDKFWYK